MYQQYDLIGQGGIGSCFSPDAVRFLGYSRKETDPQFTVRLIDGDVVEEKNLKRQQFKPSDLGIYKAQLVAEQCPKIDGVFVEWFPNYIDKDNVGRFIEDRSVVILMVDNDKTRNIIQTHCLTLNNIMLINGGNEVYDGDVTVFRKHKGEVLMPPIWEGQPHIQDPKDKHPNDSCEERYEADPQLFTTNRAVATEIMKFITPVVLKKEIIWRRKFFDIRRQSRVESNLSEIQALKLGL
jgi:molybdopterin/thiamine biosynthesis adenylyltransferase